MYDMFSACLRADFAALVLVHGLEYLSGSSVICQRGANSHFFRGFSIFRPMHQNFVP